MASTSQRVSLRFLARASALPAARGWAEYSPRRRARYAAGKASASSAQSPPPEALARLQAHWQTAIAQARLHPVGERIATVLTVEASGLDYLTHALTLHAVRLLEDVPRSRLRICAGPQCGWFYLDTSKAGRRRWCDMATCGNAEKTRRHRTRP